MAKSVEFQIRIKDVDGGVLKDLTVQADGLDDALGKIGETARGTGSRLKDMAEKSLVFDVAMRSLGTLRDMVSGLAAPFNSFETAMRSANTMAGKSGEEFGMLTDKVIELSRNIPLAREELAGGLYQVISNGVPEDNWIDFLEKSSRSAVGGIADLGQTVTVTSTLIKNYGLEWDQAGAIQDKIQTTAKNGVTSFEQLGQALPRVSGSAAQLGAGIDELMAVFATATGVTGNTAEVSTQLSAVLNALIKPSAEATKAAEAMGIGFNAASVQAAGGLENFLVGLDASIQEYSAKTGQLSETIYGQLFGSAEALRLLGSLTGEQKDKFSENIGAMADSAGTIDEAFNEMSSTGDSVGQMLKNQVQSMLDWAGSLASTSAPYMEMIANTGLAMMSLAQLRGGLMTVIAGLRGVKVATLAQAAASKVVAIASNIWKAAQTALNFVLSANPIGIVVMAIAALVAALVTAYKNSETFRNICNQVWAVVKELAGAVWNFLVKAFEKVGKVVKTAWEWVKKFFGIKDDGTAKQTDGIDRQTKSLQANTEARKAAAQEALKENRRQNAPLSEGGGKKHASKNKGTGAEDRYSGKSLIEHASSYKELGNNIQYYQNKLELTKGTETETINLYARKISVLQKQQEAISRIQEMAARPEELKTLKDIDAEIAYQQALREQASVSELASVDAEILRLSDLKAAFERNAHVNVGIDKIKTYRQLENELQYYTELMKTATAAERTEIQKQINALDGLRKEWDDTLEELKMPDEISRLNTIQSLDDAISYYQTRQKKASASEVADIQRTVMELEKKRDAIKRLTRIPEVEEEVARLDSLDGRELTIELKAVGLDGVKKRIKELQDMLSDTKNPVDEAQRERIQGLIGSYENYERTIRKSNVTFTKTWGTLKNVGGGISSLTDALQGNRDAWSKITGVIDAAIRLYEGITGIISIVQALTAATASANTVAGASMAVTTAASTAKTTAAGEEIAASTAKTLAVKAEAMAYRELAASEFMAAHAYIPFAGAGIAAGFIAMMQGLVASVAFTPFANGGVVYGPTLGLFGEYAGAKSNPEVVAPLDKLKSLIGNSHGGDAGGGALELRVKGRDLVAVLANETRINRKNTNIKI